MKITREFKTGVVSITIIALFIWGYNYLKGTNLFEGPIDTYFAEYPNVQGLRESSLVTLNGVEVGKVLEITFNKDLSKKGMILVEFSAKADLKFSKNSIAKIYSSSIMGGKSLAIIPSFDGESAKSGDYLQGVIEPDMFSTVANKLSPLQHKVEDVIVNADTLVRKLNNVLDAKTQTHLRASIAQLNEVIVNFNASSKAINQLVQNNQEKLGNTLANADKIAANLEKITDSLHAANFGLVIKDLETSVANINSIINSIKSGDGSLGKLVNDDKMYNNLTNASKELEELLREVKLHPKRFVHFSIFGKKDKGYITEPEQP